MGDHNCDSWFTTTGYCPSCGKHYTDYIRELERENAALRELMQDYLLNHGYSAERDEQRRRSMAALLEGE